MSKSSVVVYGVGGFGREVAWLIEQCADAGQDVEAVCFVDDNPVYHGKTVNNLPVHSLADAVTRFPHASIAVGVGNPSVREKITNKAIEAGMQPITIIHPRVEQSRWVEYGQGVLVCAGNIITTNIVLGNHVQINLDCTIGHDVVFDDYVTLAPGVHISGCVHLGKRVYIGTGAVIINGTPDAPITVGDDAVIGAGACVTKSVPAATTVVGVPARPLVR